MASTLIFFYKTVLINQKDEWINYHKYFAKEFLVVSSRILIFFLSFVLPAQIDNKNRFLREIHLRILHDVRTLIFNNH